MMIGKERERIEEEGKERVQNEGKEVG